MALGIGKNWGLIFGRYSRNIEAFWGNSRILVLVFQALSSRIPTLKKARCPGVGYLLSQSAPQWKRVKIKVLHTRARQKMGIKKQVCLCLWKTVIQNIWLSNSGSIELTLHRVLVVRRNPLSLPLSLSPSGLMFVLSQTQLVNPLLSILLPPTMSSSCISNLESSYFSSLANLYLTSPLLSNCYGLF